ncbi:MAG: insulinase family protein [Acidobacteria bacterium]|nr:insulinase family protein [Acidobacteriota bacterium]
MKLHSLLAVLLLTVSAAAQQWQVPIVTRKLPNGLTVVVSEDHSAPTFGLAITYGIGFRLEPEGRSGFAHLFEHMMFEGTPKAPKGTLDRVIEAGGGSNNGFTRWDYTTYIEAAPVSALDPILWIEADRMTTLDFSKENLDNQRAVVQEEVRNNVLNQPYGGLEWLELPQKAFDRYPNAHNFYGDFKDLDAANLDDVRKFFEQYYAPNNAVLAIAGDVDPEEVFAKVERFFGGIPSRALPKQPDVFEAPQTAERTATQPDKLAPVPAIAIGYRMPPRRSREAVVAAVVGELLHNGQASRLYQALVKEKKVAAEVGGGLHWPIGNPFEFDGPALLTTRIDHPGEITGATVMAAYDAVIDQLAAKGPDRAELERMRAKMRSDWYRQLEAPLDRAVALAHATLFDGKPDRVNQIPGELATVAAEEVRAFVKKYLVRTNRTVIYRVPAPAEKSSAEGGN